MVRAFSIIALFAAVVSVTADGVCQCLYKDGSHCCVVEYGLRKDRCTSLCLNNGPSGKPNCNANGAHTYASEWHGGWRLSCRD
ncbi:Ff.00g086220.m01.CDS01 [Fusarium sp. VM40]|nr:Ff.00g086220.m01.CDS01 [Fusarium sp. VM40]